jgi:hypothetical protein
MWLTPVEKGAMCYVVRMIAAVMPSAAQFTPGEREYIRRELDQFFGTLPTVVEGFQLRTWRGGPQRGQPKLPPPAKSLVDRGFMRLDTSRAIPRLFFTDEGMIALREMMADKRLADPTKFAHVRRELGIDPGFQPKSAE